VERFDLVRGWYASHSNSRNVKYHRVILDIIVTFLNMSKLTLDEILSKGTGVQEDGLLALPGVVAIATDLKS